MKPDEKKISLFKWSAFGILYLYLGILIFAFIFCSSRPTHSVGLTMHTVQGIRIDKT